MPKNRIIEFKKVEINEKSIFKNNNAEVVGHLVDEPKPNHKNLDTQYFIAHIKTPFETKDGVKENIIPILLTDRDIQETEFIVGETFLARGRLSSIRLDDGSFSEFLFTKKNLPIDKETVKYRNHVELDGYIRRKPSIRESFNKYKDQWEKQVETLITIPRPAGKSADGKDKIKTDTVTIAFRGNFVKAALKLQKDDRISLRGYIEECKDSEGNLIKYVVVPTDVTVLIEKDDLKPVSVEKDDLNPIENVVVTEEVPPIE